MPKFMYAFQYMPKQVFMYSCQKKYSCLKSFYKDRLPKIPVAKPRHQERHQRTEPVEQTIWKIDYGCHAKHC